MRILSSLTVEARHGTFGSQRWMALLSAIGSEASIAAAARHVGLSYKAAWDAIEAMNNLADKPLVERVVGGKGGGGTRLTPDGERLVATWREVEAENARFIESLNARIAHARPGLDLHDLNILARFDMQTSARNHLSGRIVRIATGAVNDEVELELSGGGRIVAIVTHESAQRMGLAEGGQAIALVKASSVIVGTDLDGVRLSTRNQLPGTVTRVIPGAVNTEVVIEVAGGNAIAAIVTNASAEQLKLAEGVPATALFKASSVILAVSP
ncbi:MULTISPECIES: TOBE domain-containing protein [unclassified Lysobacter]|uniref:TOBE domain-containing protein n=1 Tax=unclassified Lysobacter TaxID=2635362 RepID=UPI001C21D363|nr:TOBE domain-containing protein [Lysobacter sp. MMG2]MBU8977840.1 TOBE domain-containing protein [Lysobacter sp. MMG2]